MSEREVVSEALLARSPVKRFVEPAEVAATVVFLRSPAAASISSADIVMDGG